MTERVYSALKQEIFDFVLLPGDRFTESEIAQRMSASRTPVREALTLLQREGFVDVMFRAGWQVKPFDEEMARVHHNITERLRIIRRIDFTQRPRIEATYQEHAKILRTIIKRRSDEAQRLLKTHIEESQAEVRKITLHMLHEARQGHQLPKTSNP